jgi:SAM-dependent methyltransferase
MLVRARQRLAWASDRVSFVKSDLQEPAWTRELANPFDAVVSALAIHNVRHPLRIREIYREIFGLVKPGGCFLNCDLFFGARGGEAASLENQLRWLREAGFDAVNCFWKELPSAIVGGTREPLGSSLKRLR